MPHTSSKKTNVEKYIRMRLGQREVHSMAVVPGRTLEVAVAEYWSMQANAAVSLCIRFRGVQPTSTNLSLHGASGFVQSDVRALLEDVVLTPAAKLTHHVRPLLPKVRHRHAHRQTGVSTLRPV